MRASVGRLSLGQGEGWALGARSRIRAWSGGQEGVGLGKEGEVVSISVRVSARVTRASSARESRASHRQPRIGRQGEGKLGIRASSAMAFIRGMLQFISGPFPLSSFGVDYFHPK